VGRIDRFEPLQACGLHRRVEQGEAEVVDAEVILESRNEIAEQRRRVRVDDDRVRDRDQHRGPVRQRGGDDSG